MNDRELDLLLKLVQQPGYEEEYWQTFPRGVTHRLKAEARKKMSEPANINWGLVWKLGLAGACAGMAVLMVFRFSEFGRPAQKQLRILSQSYRQLAGLFPKQIEAIVLESGEFHLQLSDRPNVASSPPLF